MIKKAEGWMPKVYKDQAGLPTIGYGHLLTSEEKKQKTFEDKELTEAEGEALLLKDVARFEQAINTMVQVELTQNQFDALCDFVFNVGTTAFGTSTLLKKLNRGEYEAVPAELKKWDKITDPKTKKKVPLAGLTRRREREAILWSKP